MATRRPPSRAKAAINSSAMPPPLPRSRSVMSRNGAPARSAAPTPGGEDHHPEASTSSNPLNAQLKLSNDAETNIQVVIRCRRRSEREIEDKSPIIVSSPGAKSREVTVQTSSPVSSLGIVGTPPDRTYPFDLVFGPEADQATIYHEVVSPMLEEVLMGYNCTLFAYGQTGTGKTYTMQGDLTPTPMGNPSAQAGMIPRVLFRLFHTLETSGADFSVKISYIELYNEELRDLLANELSAPAGTTQPMGMASKDHGSGNANGGNSGLKIFDDASKRGVFIQGLEEILVKDSADALALLTKGSLRRQIAATKFNDHSSRSHSVFSVTVHIKETSPLGDDLLKIGKLNLVDLAGSENIGRSGAENKRAREAGMINQSLLTLGRVINGLVDKAQHIPYRESKLTRLLQDSLGGRTKTCIIATISPARSNMEETLSTLDYAMRAKSIRNKPELNQRMTRNSLLKEYVAEIERLKADVLAAREKNGIFFSEETWSQLSAEQELRLTEMEEAKKQVEIMESQMRSVREEFEQSIALLMKRDGELKATTERLKETEDTLQIKENELKAVKVALEEEIIMKQAHQETESILHGVAGNLKKVAKESVRDVERLFSKLQRKTSVSGNNSKVVLTHGKSISSDTKALTCSLEEFIKSSSHHTDILVAEAKRFESRELEALAAHSERIEQQLQRAQETLALIKIQDGVESEALSVVQEVIKETIIKFRNGFGSWGENVKTSSETMCGEIERMGIGGITTVEKALKSMAQFMETIVEEAQSYADAEREAVLQASSLATAAANSEIVRLRRQNEALLRLVETEKLKGERAQDQLIQRVSGLLGDFTRERDQGLRDAVEAVRVVNDQGVEELRAFAEEHREVMNNMSSRTEEVALGLDKRSGEGKRLRDGTLKSVAESKSAFSRELAKTKSSLSESLGTYTAYMQKEAQALSSSSTDAFDRHSQAKRARIDAANALNVEMQSEYRYLQRGIASTSRNVEDIAGKIASESTTFAGTTDAYHRNIASRLSSVNLATKTLLEQGTTDDLPTGTTPRKRVWQYVDQWELTQSRDVVLRAWRKKGISSVGSETFIAEHLPLPADDNDASDENDENTDVSEDTQKIILCPPDADILHELEIASPISPPVSLVSSLSSTSSISVPEPLPRPPPPKRAGGDVQRSGLPAFGTLAESRAANTYAQRLRRR